MRGKKLILLFVLLTLTVSFIVFMYSIECQRRDRFAPESNAAFLETSGMETGMEAPPTMVIGRTTPSRIESYVQELIQEECFSRFIKSMLEAESGHYSADYNVAPGKYCMGTGGYSATATKLIDTEEFISIINDKYGIYVLDGAEVVHGKNVILYNPYYWGNGTGIFFLLIIDPDGSMTVAEMLACSRKLTYLEKVETIQYKQLQSDKYLFFINCEHVSDEYTIVYENE